MFLDTAVSAILHCAVRCGGFLAGCPSGQRERSVKPSAKPTQVRTLDLPPPAKTHPELGRPRFSRDLANPRDGRLDAALGARIRVSVPNTCQSLPAPVLDHLVIFGARWLPRFGAWLRLSGQDALGVDPQQNLHTVAGPLGDLRRGAKAETLNSAEEALVATVGAAG